SIFGTLFEKNTDPIELAQLAMEGKKQSSQCPIGKEQMGETKSEFVVVEEEDIIDVLFLSFEAPDL
ncbi:hypothetical protein KI387_007677, partial [Taxus chinensis]